MNEHLNLPEQNSNQVGDPLSSIYGSPRHQDSTPMADLSNDFEPYEETVTPYLKMPSESAQPAWQMSSAPVADSPAYYPPGDAAATVTQKDTKRNWGNLIALVTLPLVGLVAFLDLFDIIRFPHIVLLIVASINLVVILATRGKG